MWNDLVINRLKEIIKLEGIIKTDDLYYKSKHKKIENLTGHSIPNAFLRDIHKRIFKCFNHYQLYLHK